MKRVFVTGDTHRNFDRIEDFCSRVDTDKDDLMIVLGDNGVNWFNDKTDELFKQYLSSFPISFFFIRGNHDLRPEDATAPDGSPRYTRIYNIEPTCVGSFLIQPEYPSLLFAIDGENYEFMNGISAFVIGGAYSIDKPYRVANGFKWFPNEQLSMGEKRVISKAYQRWIRIKGRNHVVLSHTCPQRFVPKEMLLKGIPRNQEDRGMELWMDKLYMYALDRKVNLRWFAGHWHTNKEDGPMTFLYDNIMMFGTAR